MGNSQIVSLPVGRYTNLPGTPGGSTKVYDLSIWCSDNGFGDLAVYIDNAIVIVNGGGVSITVRQKGAKEEGVELRPGQEYKWCWADSRKPKLLQVKLTNGTSWSGGERSRGENGARRERKRRKEQTAQGANGARSERRKERSDDAPCKGERSETSSEYSTPTLHSERRAEKCVYWSSMLCADTLVRDVAAASSIASSNVENTTSHATTSLVAGIEPRVGILPVRAGPGLTLRATGVSSASQGVVLTIGEEIADSAMVTFDNQSPFPIWVRQEADGVTCADKMETGIASFGWSEPAAVDEAGGVLAFSLGEFGSGGGGEGTVKFILLKVSATCR